MKRTKITRFLTSKVITTNETELMIYKLNKKTNIGFGLLTGLFFFGFLSIYHQRTKLDKFMEIKENNNNNLKDLETQLNNNTSISNKNFEYLKTQINNGKKVDSSYEYLVHNLGNKHTDNKYIEYLKDYKIKS